MNFSLLLQVDLSDGSRGGFVVSCLSCFGGGVILTTALTHMLPEVNLFLQYNIQQGQLIDRVRIFKNQHCPEWRNKQIFFPIQNFRVGHWLRSGFSVVSSWSTLWRRWHNLLQSSNDTHTDPSLGDPHNDETMQPCDQTREARERSCGGELNAWGLRTSRQPRTLPYDTCKRTWRFGI